RERDGNIQILASFQLKRYNRFGEAWRLNRYRVRAWGETDKTVIAVGISLRFLRNRCRGVEQRHGRVPYSAFTWIEHRSLHVSAKLREQRRDTTKHAQNRDNGSQISQNQHLTPPYS